MILIDTELRQSVIPGAGFGLFALKSVKRGGLVWAWDNRLDRIISKDVAEKLPAVAKEFLWKYATLRPIGWCLDSDNSRFINHSMPANLSYDAFGRIVAVEDIQVGDELTCDYATLAEVPSIGGMDGCNGFTVQAKCA